MEALVRTGYHVIQFIELPYKNVDNYAIVPNSWIRIRNSRQEFVNVAYPVEDPAKIRERVENYERYDKNWKVFLALVKYKCVELHEADMWVEAIINDVQGEDDDPENTNSLNYPETYNATENNILSEREITATEDDQSISTEDGDSYSAAHDTPSTSKVNDRPHLKVESFKSKQNISTKESFKRKMMLALRTQLNAKRLRTVDMATTILSEQSNGRRPTEPQKLTDETCQAPNVNDQSDLQCNTGNVRSIDPWLPDSSYPPGQSDEHQQRLSMVSEEYLLQNHHNRVVPGNSTGMNSNDNRTYLQTYPLQNNRQTLQPNSSALKALQTLTHQKYMEYQPVHKRPYLMVNNGYLYNQPPGQEPFDRRSNHTEQRTFAEDESRNRASYPRQQAQLTQGKQYPPAHQDAAPQSYLRSNTTRNTEMKRQLLQSIKKNMQPGTQHLLNEEYQRRQIHKELYYKTQTYNVQLLQNSHINKITVPKNTEIECSNQTALPQCIPNSILPAESNRTNVANTPFPLFSHLPEPFPPQMIVRTSNGNPINRQNNTHAMHIPPSLRHLSNPQNQPSQLLKLSSGNNSRASQNNLPLNPRSQELYSGRSAAVNCTEPAPSNLGNESTQFPNHNALAKGIFLKDPYFRALYVRPPNNQQPITVETSPQSATTYIPSALQNLPPSSNLPGHLFKYSNCVPYPPIYENNALQRILHPDKESFVRAPENANNYDQGASIQGNTMNTPFAVQNHLNLENQMRSQTLSKRQPFPSIQNVTLQDSRLQEESHEIPSIDGYDQIPRNIPVNTSSVPQYSTTPLNCSCCPNCCTCFHRKPVSQDYSGQDLPKTNIGRLPEDNSLNTNLFSETNTENKITVIQNSLNSVNQSIENSTKEPLSSNLEYSGQRLHGQEIFDDGDDDQNCSEEDNLCGNNTEKTRPSTKNYTSVASQTFQSPMEEQYLPICVDASDEDNMSCEEMSVEVLNNENNESQNTRPEYETNSTSTTAQVLPNKDIISLETRAELKQAVLNQLQALYESMHLMSSEREKFITLYSKTNNDMSRLATNLYDYVKRTIEENQPINEDIASVSTDITKTKNNVPKNTNTTKLNSYDNEYDNDDDNDDSAADADDIDDSDYDVDDDDYEVDDGDDDTGNDDKAPKKNSSRCIFILPPEYDPNNTRWTLKHKTASPGIVELMPDSQVFVCSIKLGHCKRVAKDYKAMARMMLMEIFSQNALSVCSWTGARANCLPGLFEVRPGLDQQARDALLTYVADHGKKCNWGDFDSHVVLSSIRSKIQDIRAKYGQRLESVK